MKDYTIKRSGGGSSKFLSGNPIVWAESRLYIKERIRTIAQSYAVCHEPKNPKAERIWEITYVFVNPRFRKNKYGSIILKDLIDRILAWNCAGIWVTPGGSWPGITLDIQKKFYRNMGFIKSRLPYDDPRNYGMYRLSLEKYLAR